MMDEKKLFLAVKVREDFVELPTAVESESEALELARDLKARDAVLFKKVPVKIFTVNDING